MEKSVFESDPFVSVVIPSYNGSQVIGHCLTSLQGQTYPKNLIEIIVADNGSSDGTPAFIAAHFPDVTVIHVRDKGSGYARNAGFAKARGEIILSTDADCVCEPTWAACLVNAFRNASPRTAAVGGLIKPFRLHTVVEKYEKAWVLQPATLTQNAPVRYTATPNAAFSAKAFRQVGGFDGTLTFDDTDLGLRLAAAGFDVSYTSDAVVRHRNPVGFRELYNHRRKYGEANFALSAKHVNIFGDPQGSQQRARLLRETAWRVLADLCKLPVSLVRDHAGKPRGWPLVDGVMAVAGYRGFCIGSRKVERLQSVKLSPREHAAL